MAEGLVVQPFSQPVEDYGSSLFLQLPTDRRFQRVSGLLSR